VHFGLFCGYFGLFCGILGSFAGKNVLSAFWALLRVSSSFDCMEGSFEGKNAPERFFFGRPDPKEPYTHVKELYVPGVTWSSFALLRQKSPK